MKIAVIGLGFVGLTAALGFADTGFDVAGYDIDKDRAETIKNGIVPFLEPGLDSAIRRTLGKKLIISSSAREAVENADIVFFCVGTPFGDDGKADLGYLFSAIENIVATVGQNCVFVIKSTVPPGTTKNEIEPYARAKGFKGSVAVNPEFLREGYCWNDFTNPDRTVCGCDDDDAHAKELLTAVYTPFKAPIHLVSPNTAEFVKYLSNSLLASLISFSNEMALIAEATGDVNVAKAFHVLHEDKRWANAGIRHYAYPGCGYGGYCLPKDTVALSARAKQLGVAPRILDGVISLNDEMPALTAQRIGSHAASYDMKIGILGLSFKPKSDDTRYSPAAKIIECLINDGYSNIYAYDPVATESFKKIYGLRIYYCDSKETICETCDIIAIVTTWGEFQGLHLKYPSKKWYDCRYWLEG